MILARAAGAVVVRGRVAKAAAAKADAAFVAAAHMKGKGTVQAAARLAATAVEARKHAREAQARITRSAGNPVVVLLIAAIQTAAAVGDTTAVARAVPALDIIAGALDFATLMLPLPITLQKRWFSNVNTTLLDAAKAAAAMEASVCTTRLLRV